MNEQLESLYLEYSKTNDVTREMFLNTYNALGAEYISMVEDEINSVKKKEDTQPINQNPTPTGDVNTPILNQEENLNVSVPLSNDLQLNQEQQQLIQPTQSNGVSSSELQLPLETTTTASDLVGANQDSLSASQEPKPTQKLKDFKTYQSELNNLKNQFTKYESELKKNPLLIEQDKIELNIKNLNSQIKSIEEDETFKQKYFKEQDLIKRINELTKTAVDKKLPQLEFNLYKNYDNELNKLNLDADYKNKSNKLNELYALRNSDATKYNEINDNTEVKDLLSKYKTSLESYNNIVNSNDYKLSFEDYKKNNSLINPKTTLDVGTLSTGVKTEKYLETPNGYIDFGNGIQLPKELLPEEKTQEEFNKEVSNLAKEVELKESGLVPTYDVNNPLWISRNVGNLKGADYVDTILQEEAEGKVKVARNENGELIDENLKPIIDKSNILWQPIGEYVKEYNDEVNKFNEQIKLNNEKVSKNNELIKNEKLRNLFLGQPEEEKSPLTTLYNRIYSDTGILLTEEQKANFKSIDDVYNFYALEKAKKDVKENPELNYNEEYNKNLNEFNPKITLEQSLNLGNKFVNSFLLGFQLEEEKIFAEARGYGAKIDDSYKKGYASDKDKDEIDFIKNLSNNQLGLSLLGQWWNSVGQKEIGTSNYKINAVLSTKEGRADVINSIVNFVNGKGNLEKELANENIVREKFKNLNNAKLGNTEALKNSINYIQSESKKINDIETQQKEVYSFIDEWKGKQVRQNEVEQEFSKTFSGYQKGDVLPSIKFIAGNTINGISDAFKSTIGGVAQLPNLAIGSDEYNDVIGQITKPTEFFGVKTSGMFSKYYDYESNGKKIRFQNGNYYEVDKNGGYKPIDLTYTQIAGLGKAKEGEEFSIAGMIGDTARMATDYALVQFTGGLALKGLSKFSQLRNIPKVASVFGEESALTTSLQRLERFSSNPVNKDYFGWFNQTLVDNYQEGKSVGMTNTQAAVYGSAQSLLTAFLARINPDVKFFKLYKELDEKLIGSILKNDKQGFLNGLKSMTNQIGGQIIGEEGQELTEQLAQEVVKQFTNTQLSDKKFDKMTSDDVLKTIITTAVTTGALSSANIATRGNVDNVIEYDNAYYNSTQLSNGQKLVMLANLNTSEIFKNFERQFITDKSKLSEVEKSVSLIKNYLDKIPNKEQYTLNTQTKAVSLLYEIDKKRKQLNQSDEVFKPEVQTEIDNLSGQLKELLDSDIKLQEEVKNNTLVDEQPQTESQQQQEQEGVQGQTTEANVQPEQTTIATEQGVSIDVDRKEVYARDVANGNIVSFVYENESEVPSVFKDRITSDSLINGKRTIRVSMSKSEADDLLKNNTPTSETEQTTKQVENQKEELSEEEQIKINLERLNAYIAAKKQRDKKASPNETKNQVGQPSETQNASLVKDLSYFENLAKDYQSFDDFYNDVSKMTDISPEVSNEFKDKYKNENNDTAKNALLNLYNAQKNTQQQEQKVETPKVELQPNQTQIADNVIATIDNITLPDGENGFKVTVSDLQGNLIEDKRGDSEFEFSTQEDVDKFINQKQRGYKLEPRKNIKQENQVSPSSQYEGAVTYTQFGEGQEGTIYYENGVAKIKDKAGKVYSANSPLVKDLKDVDGNAIQLQKSNERLTPITKQAFDALVKKLQKAFPRFAKVTYDFEAFKKQAEKLGATFNDIQRMVMAFHGSPHSFDKFTTEKIGTGEGAQAFGWGLYFTDVESIARNYAKNLGKRQLKQQYKGEDVIPQSPVDAAAGILNNAQYNTIKLAIEQAKNLRDIAIIDFPDRVDFWNNVINILSKSKKSDFKKVESKVLYSVSLHKGKTPDQYTWLEWDKPLSESILNKIFPELSNSIKKLGIYNEKYTSDAELKNLIINEKATGDNVYTVLKDSLGSDKEASLFLLRAGIDGIKYPAESISRGTTSDTARGFNYVVFDENAVTIEDKIQFMQTPNGTIYGAKLPDGTIYLNPQFLNANTPIHEFSHLFEQLLPSRFKSGVELLKQTNLGKKLFEQLKQEGNYANLTDEQLWGEALNTHIGNFGENEVNNPKGKLKKLQDWIKDFFAKVGDVLGIKKLTPDTQLRMFTEGVVKDLLGGKPIVAENQVSPSEQVQYSFLTENDYDTNGNIKPEVLAEIQAEREAIKSEAQANGTFMKAPNGKATNLNEAQWIDVRTKRFKDWFGDWENDAKNASKVVDENGEPLVVYHGTKDNFNEFDSKKQSNKGFWFTPKKNLADGYSMARNSGEIGNVFSVFLNIKNPANNDWVSKSNPNSEIITNDMVSFDELGYDGWISVIGGKTTSLVALNPNQIKSATSNIGTYSANTNDIRYSINSTTPLSVKEQTEVINELVSNGEESAFAKLQETNWYKGLSEEQKQNINPTNIAETIANAVNSNKRNLEQKVERRVAKIENIKSAKEVIQQTILDAKEKGLFKGVTSSSVLEYAMRRINRAVTPYQQKQVLNIVKKIINDNEYLNKVKEAVNTQKDIKKKANSKSISKPLVNVNIAKEFAKINPRNVKDIDEFLALAKAVKSNLSGIAVNNKLEVKNKNYTINNESIQKYIDDNVKYNETLKEEALKDDYNELVRTSNLPVANMTFEEYKDFINLSKLEENATKFDDESKATKEERTKVLSEIVNERLNNDFKTEVYDKKSEFTEAEQTIIERLFKIDTSTLDYKQLVKLNDIINNAVYNGDLMDAGSFSFIPVVQENGKKIDEFKEKNNYNFLTLKTDLASEAAQELITNDMLIEFMTNSTDASVVLKINSGISKIMNGNAKASIQQKKAVNTYIKMKEKVGWKSDTTENRYIRQIYAEMVRDEGGNEDEKSIEFTRKKGLIAQTFKALKDSYSEQDKKDGKLLEEIYNKTLGNANTVEEVKNNILKLEFGKFNIESVEYWIGVHNEYADDFIEQGRLYNNKDLEKEVNYTSRKYKPISRASQIKQDDEMFDEVRRSLNIKYTESGSKNKVRKRNNLPEGLVLDMDFDKVQSKVLFNNLYDLYTLEGISILKEFLKDPKTADRIGGKSNVDKLTDMMRRTILSQKQAMPFENSKTWKLVDKASESIMLKSTRLALGSIEQLPQQYLSVLFNTALNLGTDVDLLFKAYQVASKYSNYDFNPNDNAIQKGKKKIANFNDLEMFNSLNIGVRGTTIAGFNKKNAIFADENAGNVDKIRAALYNGEKLAKSIYDATMKSLEFSDVQIARTSWLAFYMKSLRKQGIDLDKIDWSKIDEKYNEYANEYAQQKTALFQNANDPSSLPATFKNTDTQTRVIKNLVLPFSSFGMNTKGRMTNDMQKILLGSIDGRASAARSLVATLLESAIFNAFKIFVLQKASIYLTETILSSVFGWDDEEINDLFKKSKEKMTPKYIATTLSDFFFGGLGSFGQSSLESVTDFITKNLNGEEYFYHYKNDPEKSGIPYWVQYSGAYGVSIGTALGLYKDTQYLDGYGEEIISGSTKPVIKEKELSSEAKKLAYLTFAIDGLAFVGIGDRAVTRVNQKIKIARDKRIKEDLGDWYKAKMYIPSNKDNFNKYAKLYVDKGYTLQEIRALAMKEGITLDKKFNSKMVDVVYEYKISKYKKEIDAVKLKYEQNKMSREDLKAFVISLDLTLKEKVKLWKELR